MRGAFSITLPASLYVLLRDAFSDDAPARKAMECAGRLKRGRGYQYRLVAGEVVLRRILGRVADIPHVASHRVSQQTPLPMVFGNAEWTPVPDRDTGRVVGYLRPGKFWDLEKDGPFPYDQREG